ncbi:caspase family protein [Aliiglaciecola sp. M165]|uniref:caspase family protein n=1 Tax=Aliiglaciecola sp. M165 TaxID=2593649 RepID=UPI00117DAE1B|nr:caspase family protein [Aliiglaciecola sp. M165]TRY29932.1 hypothetical protein FM019_17365 [Aliiglaciecola sp. M165]
MARNHALLIGIDKYPKLDPRYGLSGCVSDARLIHSILTSHFGFQANEIRELYDDDANQTAIFQAMQKLVDEAQSGDCVVFHFAGHGSQRTCLDDSEGSGMDSTIMPSDSGRGAHPNLDISDDEIGEWLEKLSTKTDNITLIFDCCHSGTITRDPWAATARGAPADTRTAQEMGLSQKQKHSATRDLEGGSFLPRSDAYVVISGCRDDELSNEYSLQKDGTQLRHGALTYWLSQTLIAAKPDSTYQDIFESASQQITALFPSQHPQIEGRRDRVLFGTNRVSPLKYFNLKSVQGNTVTINGGAAHGVVNGSEWAVYPPGTNNTEQSTPLTKLTVMSVDALTAEATVESTAKTLTKDCRCILLSSPVAIPTLSIDISEVPEKIASTLQNMIDTSGLLDVSTSPATADLRIQSKDSQWTALSKDERPVLPLQDLQQEDDFSRFISNLETRSRAQNVLKLANPESQLNVDFNVYRSTDGANWTKVDENTVFVHGDRVAFELINNEDRDLFLSVLDIGLSGRVALFYPPGHNSEKITSGQTLKVGFNQIKIQLGVPADFEQPIGRETFKAMISTDETSFAWLQQSGTRSLGPSTLLQKMMQQAMEGSHTRDPIISWAEPGEDWQGISRSFELQKTKELSNGP